MNDRSNDRRPPPPSSSRNNNYDRQERGKHFEQALKAEDDRSYDRSYDQNVYEDYVNNRAPPRNAQRAEADDYPRRMNENSARNDRNEGDYGRTSRLPQSDYSRERNPVTDYQRQPTRNEWDISGYDNYSDSKNNHQWQHCDREENDYQNKGRYCRGTEVTQKPSGGHEYDSKDYGNDAKPRRENYRNESESLANEEPLRRGGGESRGQESVERNQSTNYGPARGDKNDGYGRGDGGYGNQRSFDDKYFDRGYDDNKPSHGTRYETKFDEQHGNRNPAPYSVEQDYLPTIKENPRSQYPVKDDYYPPPSRTNTAQRSLDTVPYVDETLHSGGGRQGYDGRGYLKDEVRDIYPPAAAKPERFPAPTTKAANSEWDENYDRYNSRDSRQSEYKSSENYGPPQRKGYANDEAERGYGNGGRKGEEYDLPQRNVGVNRQDSAPQRYGSNADVGRSDLRPPPENSNYVGARDPYIPKRSTRNESDQNVDPYIYQDRNYSRDRETTRAPPPRVGLGSASQGRDNYGLPRNAPDPRTLDSRPIRIGSINGENGSTRGGAVVGGGGGYNSATDGNGGYDRDESRATRGSSTTGGYEESRPTRGSAINGGGGYDRASNNDDKYPSDRGNSKQQESGYGRLPPPPSTIGRRPLTDSRPYNNNQTDPSQDYSNRREKQYANSPSNNNDRSGYGNNPRGGYGASTRGTFSSGQSGSGSRGGVGESANLNQSRFNSAAAKTTFNQTTTFANNPTRGSSSRPPATTNATPRPIPVISDSHKPPSSATKTAAPPENTDDEWN